MTTGWHLPPPPGVTPFLIPKGNSFTIPDVVPTTCENCGRQIAQLHISDRDVIEDDDWFEVAARGHVEIWISHTAKRCRAFRRHKEQADA